VLHNAVQLDDGTWMWRHQRFDPPDDAREVVRTALWDELSAVRVPVLLVRAMGPGSVVDDQDEAEFRRRQPSARVVHVAGSGHSVQGDQPLVLADVLAAFLDC
jgi:pimeloyl-ACP methyl ester carboxylesterase